MYGLKNMLIQEQKHLNDIICRAKEDIKNNMGLTPWECIENNIED